MRVGILVDGDNVTFSARSFGKKVDWARLRDYLADPNEERDIVEMIIYLGLPPETDEHRERRERKNSFVHWLRTHGFMVVTKEGTPSGEGSFKANVDCMMTADALEFAVEARPDVVVLCTGDSDFAYLANKLRRRGIRVEVASVEQSLASQLKAAANSVVDLATLFNEFQPIDGGQPAPLIGTEAAFDEIA